MQRQLGHAVSPVRVLGEWGGEGGESEREGVSLTAFRKKGVNL